MLSLIFPVIKKRRFARLARSSLLLVVRHLCARGCALISGGIPPPSNQEADREEEEKLNCPGAGCVYVCVCEMDSA